ncbi:Rce1 [Kluyveromyces lactis]|nr:Rce1 [Kluyveromyces lactis]
MFSRPADVVAVYISLSYVVAVHTVSRDVNEFKIRRDDPKVITARMKAVVALSVFHLTTIPLLLKYMNGDSIQTTLLRFGLIPGFLNETETGLPSWVPFNYFKDSSRHLSLAIVLYSTPLLDSLLHYCFLPDKSYKDIISDICYEFSTIWGLRDYIFGPITEELFYTSMMLVAYLRLGDSSQYDANYLTLIVPNLFGIAHMHHAFEQYSLGIMNLANIIFITLLQMSYTWLFGSFTNYLFLNSSGNLWSCILIHTFCNYMGLPQGNTFSKAYALVPIEKRSNLGTLFSSLWRLLYLPLLVTSIVLFKNNLTSLTSGTYEPIV